VTEPAFPGCEKISVPAVFAQYLAARGHRAEICRGIAPWSDLLENTTV
jgi:hypothetical protein